ncbi:hypothetical protein GCM10023340_21670 [Nocardioides marinquilinus]|uniref:YbaB/EbfC DNA-binding family protein n=1 Tax=Nocardioides marinquilinus TaxID=1210400 RepID=A0ABP9PKL2_9ACTN
MTDAIDARLSDLARRTQEFAQQLEASLSNVAASQTTSEQGGVTVRLGADGTVERVVVADAWRREATPAELGNLVLTTMGLAFGEQFRVWAERAPDELDKPVPRTVPRPTRVVQPPRGPAGDHYVNDTVRAVGGVEGALDDLIDALRIASDQRFEGRDRTGHVVATADGRGQLMSLDLDPEWVDGSPASALGVAATEAMQDAVARSRAGTDLQGVVEESRLGRLHRSLVNDAPAS